MVTYQEIWISFNGKPEILIKMKFTQLPCEECRTRHKSLFHFCRLDELSDLSLNKSCTTYKSGQTIFHERNMPSGLYCVNGGKIKLHKMGSDGKEQIIRLVKPGDFIGYRALMSDTPYAASATVLEEATICYVPKQSFFGILKDNENVSDGLMKLLCKNLEESEKRLTEMAYKPVRERLAEALLMIKNTYDDEDSEEYTINMTREDLANLVGTAKETVIRLLSELKKDEVVRTEGRKITIMDKDALVRISNMYD